MKKNDLKFDYDDILIEPELITNINSRYNDITLGDFLPLMTAPMDTVVDINNIDVFLDNKINVVIPRTVSWDEFLFWYWSYYSNQDMRHVLNNNVFYSFGLSEIKQLIDEDVNIIPLNLSILIDVANGHMSKINKVCKQIKLKRPDIKIMVGNIANPNTYKFYAKEGNVDFIRCGIGNGNGCLTTKQSAIGYPKASLIHEIKRIKDELDIPEEQKPAIIADGGIKDYSDAIKALAIGADYVMIGSIFNKAFESCAQNYWHKIKLPPKIAKYLFNKGFTIKKYFRGMSTKEAQKAMGKTKLKTSEGVVRFRKVEYSLSKWVENFEHYLRSSMSYCNCKNLNDYIGKVNIIQITKGAFDRFNK